MRTASAWRIRGATSTANSPRYVASVDSTVSTYRPGACSPAGSSPTCDVTALGSVYLGAFGFSELVRAGRAEELRRGAAARAEQAGPRRRDRIHGAVGTADWTGVSLRPIMARG